MNKAKVIPETEMRLILGDGLDFSMDCRTTRLNNNVLVIGSSGTGKTSHIVLPNILRGDRNIVCVDPKGNLYSKTKEHLESVGYEVYKLDLSDPSGKVGYNFFDYIKSEHDVIKLAHILVYSESNSDKGVNEYFYQASEQVVASAIATCLWIDHDSRKYRTLQKVLDICKTILFSKENPWEGLDLNSLWADLSFRLGKGYRELPEETAGSVLSTIHSVVGKLNTRGTEQMMLEEKTKLNIRNLADQKMTVFVTVSDTDRSYDALASIFFSQCMDMLCHIADTKCRGQSLPIHTQFIYDDFATNFKIDDFPKEISAFRSRNISAMLMIQAESQLSAMYQKDSLTVISSCDSILFLGSNDLESCKHIAERADVPLRDILYMPLGAYFLFRRGQKEPVQGINQAFGIDKQNDINQAQRVKGRTK